MKLIFKILTLISLASNAFGQDGGKLYPIIKGNLYGYIDPKGKTIIEPQFLSVGEFSEGLSPVRLNGTYGYIDRKGAFVILPKYDLALPFYKGLAKVFIDGKPYFIDKKGNITFSHNYKSISEFGDNSFAIAITQSNKYGVVNKVGDLMIDTIYSQISSFTDGVSVVTGLNHNPYPNDSTQKVIYEKGVIDTLGNWKVRYGEYIEIGEFHNGYAHVRRIEEQQKRYYGYEELIDKTGKYRFTVPSEKWNFGYLDNSFYQDIAIVKIHSTDLDTVNALPWINRSDFKGAINTDGKIILSNTDWVELTPFTYNRAFVQNTSGKWLLINTQGETVISQSFENILYNVYSREKAAFIFQDGIAFVETENGWGAIDTTGKFVIEPRYLKNVKYNYLIRRGDIIFLEEDISVENETYAHRYGFWNTANNTIVEPKFHGIDMNGFGNDLICVIQEGKFGYINAKGQQIWEEQNKPGKKQLNIDYMNIGYYYASSKYQKKLAGLGVWESFSNNSAPLNFDVTFSPDTLQIVIDTNQRTNWAGGYDSIKLFIANTSGKTLYFDTQDSRLYLKFQAQDKNGKWQDIEYLPNSDCGLSYYTLYLAPNELWAFTTPLYQGAFKTKMRAELLYKKSKKQKKIDIIYSNEVECYVNPGQFWSKREYLSSGLINLYGN